jgi:arylsulfatase A-like enzyme
LTEAVDVQVDRLLEALRKQDLEGSALVLFTSDHGQGMTAHCWAIKLMLYEEPLRVPFIVRWPGKIPAGVVDGQHLVSGLDVLPTLCD